MSTGVTRAGQARASAPRHRRGRGERGVATVQLVVLMPALFALMFTAMQAALIYHGRTVAIAAAEQGAQAAAAQSGTSGDGRAAATAFVAAAGGAGVLNVRQGHRHPDRHHRHRHRHRHHAVRRPRLGPDDPARTRPRPSNGSPDDPSRTPAAAPRRPRRERAPRSSRSSSSSPPSACSWP